LRTSVLLSGEPFFAASAAVKDATTALNPRRTFTEYPPTGERADAYVLFRGNLIFAIKCFIFDHDRHGRLLVSMGVGQQVVDVQTCFQAGNG
jgi:hypothetical protein